MNGQLVVFHFSVLGLPGVREQRLAAEAETGVHAVGVGCGRDQETEEVGACHQGCCIEYLFVGIIPVTVVVEIRPCIQKTSAGSSHTDIHR